MNIKDMRPSGGRISDEPMAGTIKFSPGDAFDLMALATGIEGAFSPSLQGKFYAGGADPIMQPWPPGSLDEFLGLKDEKPPT
ncbi:hypothetical protein HOU02_gp489 [Caulobacter phage CcrBL9]|uniref:Uncharacterized protein n=1 Tax=Caulobacter phage CcrBL9 TaxID=2283270 RepID=A0A385EC24_9CAUD|nr:hypothetical protein HOU02_gp489 [Caulobacter phage CcrBL9]AXQ69236.1 hypothetical protein CcrBL9_gp212c [Caulobacter phage CcrBL9]